MYLQFGCGALNVQKVYQIVPIIYQDSTKSVPAIKFVRNWYANIIPMFDLEKNKRTKNIPI
jgi:hypothetical protein